MTPASATAVAVVQAQLEAYNSRNLDAFVALLDAADLAANRAEKGTAPL